MTTRRDFLQLALTAPLLPTSLGRASSDSRIEAASAHTDPGSIYAVLCDERFAESVVRRGDGEARDFGYAISWRHY